MTTDELIEKVKTLNERREAVQLFHMIPELITEIWRLQRSADGWQEEARRYAANADYWRNKCVTAKFDCPQGIKCPYLQKELEEKDAKYENLKSAWRGMFASKQLVLDDLEKTREELNRSEIIRASLCKKIEDQKVQIAILEKVWAHHGKLNTELANKEIQAKDLERTTDYCRRLAGYTEALELEFLKTYSRMFWHENSWEGNCLLDCDAVARAVLADIKSRHL